MAMVNPGLSNWVSWWPLGEAGGATDVHGANDLTETGGTIAQVAGLIGNASDFESTETEWYTIASNASLQIANDSCMLGVWVKAESVINYYSPMAKDSGTNGHREFKIETAGGKWLAKFSYDGTNETTVVSSVGPSAGNWQLLFISHDAVNNLIGISVNEEATVTAAFNAAGVFASDAPFNIGAEGAGSNYFDGLECLAFMCRKLLTADQRSWMFNGGSARSYSELGIPKVASFNGVPMNLAKTVNGLSVASIKSVQGIS